MPLRFRPTHVSLPSKTIASCFNTIIKIDSTVNGLSEEIDLIGFARDACQLQEGPTLVRRRPMNSFAVRLARNDTGSSAPHRNPAANAINSRNDNARFRSVVLPHLKKAYALARWLTGNRTDAEDVVQTACLRALRGINNFSNGNSRAWVLTIVRHAAYDWCHKNRPAALVPVADLEGIEAAQSSDRNVETPETALIAKVEAKLLETAITALPAVFRETLILRDIQGLAYREIAEVTGVPTGTVMSRLARARGRLLATMANSSVAE
jgi:RNA polymerase sigma factor (sigma-70 family)